MMTKRTTDIDDVRPVKVPTSRRRFNGNCAACAQPSRIPTICDADKMRRPSWDSKLVRRWLLIERQKLVKRVRLILSTVGIGDMHLPARF